MEMVLLLNSSKYRNEIFPKILQFQYSDIFKISYKTCPLAAKSSCHYFKNFIQMVSDDNTNPQINEKPDFFPIFEGKRKTKILQVI